MSYKWIQEDPYKIMGLLDSYDSFVCDTKISDVEVKEYYYHLREKYNQYIISKSDNAEVAALLIWLNKHCFNGLYRCNSKGLFNVPFANSRRISYNKNNILEVSNMLKNVKITNGDFEDACKEASEGDFIFFDSPYAPLKPESFTDYTKEGFSLDDHKRLATLFKKLSDRGCYCILTNHNTALIKELYSGFRQKIVNVKRSINCDAANRNGEEIIIWNF